MDGTGIADGASRRRQMREWVLRSTADHHEPFAEVVVTGTFISPSGRTVAIEGFYDGDATWRVRFNPDAPGTWSYRIAAMPDDPDLIDEGTFDVVEHETPGFLRSTPGQGWGFATEDGEPVFLFGDTVYHLFGMAHDSGVGFDAVRSFVERRAAQGFNLLRIRLPVSPFHMPDGRNTWQTIDLWPWGGSAQMPRFDRFNLPYFQTCDRVMAHAAARGMHVELIMEGWGNEFPFNDRGRFVPEWEELWLRYLIARFDAYPNASFWTLQNEYEYYPNGDWRYAESGVADRWALRVAHLVRRYARHGHIIAIHNGPRLPPFSDRLRADPGAIDTVMFQTWGTTSETDGWLAAGIEDDVDAALAGWRGSAVLSEWGYERNPTFDPLIPGHAHCDVDHTRRGAWRGVFSGLGIVHGFENSWGPWAVLDEDQTGLAHLLHVRDFVTRVIPFADLHPAHHLATGDDLRRGRRPLVLTGESRDVVAVYLPAGGSVRVDIEIDEYTARWFDPRTGEVSDATTTDGAFVRLTGDPDRPDDWVLVLRRT